MRLGYNTNGLQNHRLEDALDLLAEHGYRVVALTLDSCHLDPFRCTPAEVASVRRRLERLGLEVVIETGARFLLDPRRKHEPTLMSPDPEGRARRLEFYRRAANIGADLGARVVSFWAGVDRRPGPDSHDRLVDGVARAAAAIRASGLVPAFEPEPGMAVETLAEFEALAAEMGGEAPALCLDVGHLYVTGEGDPAELIGRHAARAVQVHLSDMRPGVHEHLAPGAGEVDFSRVLRSFKASGYDGPVCFELSRSSHVAPQAVADCRRVWDRYGC